MKKSKTMTLTAKRQTILPLNWCRRAGLERGGRVNVMELDNGALLIHALKPHARAEVKKLLGQPAAGNHTPKQIKALIDKAMREWR